MCGRISIFAELGDLASQFRFDPGLVEAAYQPSWNIPPTAPILAVTAGDGERRAAIMRWGFTFRDRRSGGSSRPLFNARSETIVERPAFRSAFASRRCLVPINGFYEWRKENGTRQPMWIHRADERPYALAGVYNAGTEEAACVITCAPNSLMEPIHNRMPVILDESDYDDWLDSSTDPAALMIMLQPREWPHAEARPVVDAVNRPANDGPELLASAGDSVPPLL